MLSWQRLERPQAGPRIADGFLDHLKSIRDRPQPGWSGAHTAAVDLIILLIGLAYAWHLSAPDLLASLGQEPTSPRLIARHRASVIEARCSASTIRHSTPALRPLGTG